MVVHIPALGTEIIVLAQAQAVSVESQRCLRFQLRLSMRKPVSKSHQLQYRERHRVLSASRVPILFCCNFGAPGDNRKCCRTRGLHTLSVVVHLQRTTSEHLDFDRSRTGFEILSGTSVVQSEFLPPACLLLYGASSASAGPHYDARCWCISMTQCVHVRRSLYGRGCLLPTPSWTQRVLQVLARLAYGLRWTGC